MVHELWNAGAAAAPGRAHRSGDFETDAGGAGGHHGGFFTAKQE